MNAWMQRTCRIVAASLVALVTQTAWAAPVYYAYSYTGNGVASAGIMTVDGVLAGGHYAITDMQGSRNGSTIDSMLAAGALGGNDNRLYPGGPYVDTAGFSFTTGSEQFNVGNAALACGSASLYGESPTGTCGDLVGVSLEVALFNPMAGASYFSYSYIGNGVASAGIFTTSGSAGGPYTIEGILGQRNGQDITALLAVGALGGNDNRLYPNEPYVNFAGFSYSVGAEHFNVGNANVACGTATTYGESPTGTCGDLVSLSMMNVTALRLSVPEPQTGFLVGLALMAAVISRRRRT